MIRKQEIQDWCVERISNMLSVPKEKINPTLDFDRLGLDSSIAVSLLVDLEEFLDIEVPPTLLFGVSSLSEIAEQLSAQLAEEGQFEPVRSVS